MMRLAVRRLFAAWTAEMDKLDIWKAIGKAEGKAEAAIRMLKKGVSPEVVADYQELPLSQINELVHQISTSQA